MTDEGELEIHNPPPCPVRGGSYPWGDEHTPAEEPPYEEPPAMTPQPVPVADLSAGADRLAAVQLVLPDRPEVEWFAVLIPVDRRDLDDPGVSAAQLGVDAGLTARDTAEQLVREHVYRLRMDARGAA